MFIVVRVNIILFGDACDILVSVFSVLAYLNTLGLTFASFISVLLILSILLSRIGILGLHCSSFNSFMGCSFCG